MIGMIGIFLPALVSVNIINVIEKQELNIKRDINRVLMFSLFINMINLAILVFIFNNGEWYLNMEAFNNQFAFRYILVSLIIAVVGAFVYMVCKKNIALKITTEKRDEKELYESSKKNNKKNKH